MKRYLTTKSAIPLGLTVLLCFFVVGEIVLKVFLPFSFPTIGYLSSPNAKIYGWGYHPRSVITMSDPDTGERYVQRANSGGWRDKDRTCVNHEKSYRILVLGDSVTFGATVPAEKVYTRILEDMLSKNGFNAEVINMGYGRWGTDQQLEALKHEGLKYRPNLVIMQFTSNDLTDNMYYSYAIQGRQRWQELKDSKPFYYALDDGGHLVRHKNPDFMRGLKLKDRLKSQMLKLEIGKRLYSVYLALRWGEYPVAGTGGHLTYSQQEKLAYSATRNQIDQLKLALRIIADDPLLQYLEGNIDGELDFNHLYSVITKTGHEDARETILRVLEKRSFHQYWSEEKYYFPEQDIDSIEWRLYFALVREAKSVVADHGSRVALFCQNDVAQYEWLVYWCWISEGQEFKDNWLSFSKIIEQFAKENDIGFVENKSRYPRSRNDPHPNIAGHRAMAEDIYHYLMDSHENELRSHRSPSFENS